MIRKILIVTALSQELNIIKSEIKKFKIPNLKISYLSTGMGNYNMILNLTRFLEKNNDFDFLVNIGICGYDNEKKDFFQVARIINSSNNKELIIPNLINFGDLESIFCSEKIIFDSNLLNGEKFVDMESYGFELVCDSFSIPRMILKIPVDKIGIETKNFDFKKAEQYLKEKINYREVLEKIGIYLEKIPKKIDFEQYFSYYNFTFSEKEIFKKLFYKYKALVGNDFEKYFSENNNYNKEDFLKNLEKYLKSYII